MVLYFNIETQSIVENVVTNTTFTITVKTEMGRGRFLPKITSLDSLDLKMND